MNRSTIAAAVLLAAACTTTPLPLPPPVIGEEPASTVHGLTLEEEASVLRMEDRREFDPSLSSAWISHANPLHRQRMALALARIGPHVFDDANGSGVREPDERMAGVDLLIRAASDPVFEVRRHVAFALGEIGDPAAVESLFRMTQDEHGDVAAEAVEALAKMASSVPLERYGALTRDPREGVRARAIRYLFRFGNDEALLYAAAALEAPESSIRQEGAYTLSRLPLAAARPRLELLLSDYEVLTRSYAARALGGIAQLASVGPLFDALTDIHPWVRTNAARAIAQIIEKHNVTDRRATYPEDVLRLSTLTRDPDAGTRMTAIETLGWYAPVSELARLQLTELATSGTRTQREIATGAIARHLNVGPSSPLMSLIQTDEIWVKVRALEGISTSPGGPALRQQLATDPSPTVRTAAVRSVPAPAVANEMQLIRNALDDPDAVVRATAAGKLSGSTALPQDELLSLLQAAEVRSRLDSENDARVSAFSALAAIDFPGREAYLRERLTDSDPVIRRLAAESFEKLEHGRRQYTPLPVEREMSEYREIARWARGRHTARIRTARGDIELVLLSQEAPLTAWNFARLAQSGYYDNTSFMRVVPNFVIQGGDPRNDMSGGPGYSIRDEINLQRYTRGAVGMALSGPDTGGSQFFITHSPQPHLDGGYTIFGRVIDGMGGVVDQMERGDQVSTIEISSVTAERKINPMAAAGTPLPVVTGEITVDRLLQWVPGYRARMQAYEPDPDVVEMIAHSIQPDDRLEVVLGTWCTDSQVEVPRFLKIKELLHEQHGVEIPTSYVAVNRAKNEPAAVVDRLGIEKVATFVWFRGERELGRITEHPAVVMEDDLLAIVARP